MDLIALQKKIQASTFLSSEEKAYWIVQLPIMGAAQAQKLDSILSEAASITPLQAQAA